MCLSRFCECFFSPSYPPLDRFAVDLLVQGVYARKMVVRPETGADLVTAVWVFIMFGNLAASAFVGFFANSHATVFFWATLPFAVQVLVPVAIGWLSEDPAPRGFQRAKVHTNRRYFLLGCFMTVGALGMVPASLFGSPVVQAAYSIAVSAVLCGSCLLLLPKQIGTTEGGGDGGLGTANGRKGRRKGGGGQEGRRFLSCVDGSRGDQETDNWSAFFETFWSMWSSFCSNLSVTFTVLGRAQVYMCVAEWAKRMMLWWGGRRWWPEASVLTWLLPSSGSAARPPWSAPFFFVFSHRQVPYERDEPADSGRLGCLLHRG